MPVPVTMLISVVFALFVAVLVLAVVVPVIVPILFVFFVAPIVLFPSDVLSPIGSFTPVWAITPVPVSRVEVAIHVTVKAHGAMEPWACADEDSPHKPLRAVVAEWCAAIWRVVEVSIRADRGDCDRDHSNGSPDSNIDADLRCCLVCRSRNANCNDG